MPAEASTAMPPPRTLFLLASGHGGVATITTALISSLREHGWPVQALAGDLSWRRHLTAARSTDVIVASNNFRPAYVAWLLGLWLRKPVVMWVHGPVLDVLALARTHFLKRLWLRWFYARQHDVVFASQTSCDSFNAFMRGTRRRQQHVIPNAVDPDFMKIAARPWKPPAETAPVRIAYVGRLAKEKQLELLIEMLRLLPARCELTFIGEGSELRALELTGADLTARQRLHFAGVRHCDALLYQAFDLTVLSSRYEGCPMAVLESLTAGVPCIASPCPAMLEMYCDSGDLMLAARNDATAMATAVLRLLGTPATLVDDAIQSVLRRYRHEEFTRNWQAALRQAIVHAG